VEVHTIYKTGVEVEAMHGAAITALTMYDMLKPVDPNVTIGSIALQSKTGGKSDYKNAAVSPLKCALIVCSDSISRKVKEDRAGLAVMDKLKKFGLQFDTYEIISDDIKLIQETATKAVLNGIQLLLYCGGTGLSKRDVTPDALESLITRPVPGLMEYARSYGQERMNYAMLSRGISGMINDTLVITLPGSLRGACETVDALFPAALHIFHMLKDGKH
jgi:molybdenum cofactor synthesis domain-containing protein